MTQTLKLYQIYFNEESYNNCFNDWFLFYNENCSDLFENEVIAKLIPSETSEYVGIFSHKFLTTPAKGTCKLKGNHKVEFEKYLIENNLDCLSFFKGKKKQTIFHNENALYYNKCFDDLMEHLGVDFKAIQTPRFIIMQNAFIMRTELYKDYVKNWLRPSIKFLNEYEPALRKTPYKGYNFKTFILERLISTYIHFNKTINCKHYGE